MPSTPALAAYKRVITSKRDGSCHACGARTQANIDFAAVDNVGKWFPFCATCAGSYAAQVAGLVKRVEALAADLTEDQVATLDIPEDAVVTAAIEGRTSAVQSIAIITSLHALLGGIVTATKVVDPRIEAVRAIGLDPSHKDRSFAQSLVSQYDTRGDLSEKQWACVDRMVAPAASTSKLAPGVYVNAAGLIVKLQANKTGTGIYSKVWTGSGWEYAPAHRNDSTLRPITAAEAAAFGHQHENCVFCSRSLTDDKDGRSVQVGYGPICASKYGLPWG